MNIYIVCAHPESASFNNSLVTTATQSFENLGHQVKVTDLYAHDFDPCEHARQTSARRTVERATPTCCYGQSNTPSAMWASRCSSLI
ncbi:NAD(P)H-dependent oxidoreductase [Pseudomonas fluorescens]|uniref:NAD(P)H-dependent oxidoreductase n=1 Tax=Pseudomonas fluorescens TaxID=294 RepID=UPI0012422BC4